MSQQPVKPRNADVIVSGYVLVEHAGGYAGFLGYGKIARSRSHHRDMPLTLRFGRVAIGDRPCKLVELGARHVLDYFLICPRVGAGRQNGLSALGEAKEYLGYLLGGLSGAVDHLRKAAPDRPVMVYGCEAGCLEW